MLLSDKQFLILGGVIIGGVFYAGIKAKKMAAEVGDAIDPTNNENVFYTGVNKIGGALTSDTNWTLGGWIYEITHGENE